GKTTTALGILRLIPDPPGEICSGKIFFHNENLLSVSESDMRKIRGSKISMIFQDPMTSLNPVITVGEQIQEVILLHNDVSPAEAMQRAGTMMEKVGIPATRVHDYPHQFSGGMKQRIVIAMAIACEPELLLADEPTTALDVTIQAQVLDLISNLKEELQTSMLLITHDLGVVAEVCDNVAIMYAGEIIEHGTVEQIFTDPKHPYTQGLFASIPNLDSDSDRLIPIEGLMPDPMNLPSGCKFHPRCTSCMEICTNTPPALTIFQGNHATCCHLYNKEGKK
ncbi:MAG: ABC transporter ATP-binding protein, partial [Spirochaetales bacterium]